MILQVVLAGMGLWGSSLMIWGLRFRGEGFGIWSFGALRFRVQVYKLVPP